MLKWLIRYLDAHPGSDPGSGGGGGGTPAPAPGGEPGKGGQPAPANNPQPAPVDPNAISAAARLEQAKALGFSSVEEMREFISKSRHKPGGSGEPDLKELQQKLEISQKNGQEATTRLNNTLKENAFLTALKKLDVNLHDIDDFKSVAMGRMEVVENDQIVIKNETGDIILNQKGERLGVADYLKSIIDAKPWLVKNTVSPGVGAVPGQHSRDTGQPKTLANIKDPQTGIINLADFEEATKK